MEVHQVVESVETIKPVSSPAPTTPYSWQDIIPPITLHYITDYDEANLKVSVLQPGPYGFDLEWKPSFRKGQRENRVALVQLANNEIILLLQISAMRSFPENLKALLESPDYIKAGAGIQYDSKKIHADCGVQMKNCVDLSLLARSVDSQWKGKYTAPLGLARLVGAYENLALGKGKTSRSNWEAVLDEKQKEYASNDAHSGFAIYSRLIMMAKSVNPVPEAFFFSYNVIRGTLCVPSGGSRLWHPHNPYYDPGPPPPPREPKDKKTGEGKNAIESPVATQLRPPGSASGTQQPQQRKYHSSGTNVINRGRGRGFLEYTPKRPRIYDGHMHSNRQYSNTEPPENG